jgi:hypothetical protein
VTPVGNQRLGATARVNVAGEIIATYCAARWWLLRLDFPAAVTAARSVHRPDGGDLSDRELQAAGVRLGNAVQRTLRVLPVDSRCLITALVLTRMLARRGIDSSLVLGVRAQPGFAAHAWVERHGVALLPTTPDFHRLSEY